MTAALAPPLPATDLELELEMDPPDAADPLLAASYARLSSRRGELYEHADKVAFLLRDLEDDVDDLHAQEGWDGATAAGARDWATDRGMVFRALRRNHYDVDKTLAFLLAALSERVERGLGGQIPPPPTNLWSILPLPTTDRLGHPVAVLNLAEVVRDESGSLAELKDWIWWGLELVRRVLRDWWADGRRGTGAEGAVIVIDVAEAGYRNMEVELLPTLFSVGHGNFPGQIETVYIVNAGWKQLTMWNTVVKRLLPRSALDRVVFLKDRDQTAAVFDLERLPKKLGGDGPEVDADVMQRKYCHIHPHSASRPGSRSASRAVSRSNSRAPSRSGSRSRSRGPSRGGSRAPSREHSMNRAAPSRNTSMSSIADIYYTAPNTPTASRPLSRRSSMVNMSSLALTNLAMTKTTHETSMAAPDPATDMPATIDAAAGSTIQRIKSLSDFHLYISPSRLANRDLLSDSEDDEPTPQPVQRRVTLRPAMLEGSIAARRAAARAIAGGETPRRASTPQESYASRLQAHHAKNFEKYCAVTDCDSLYRLDRSWTPTDSASPVSVNSTAPTTAPTSDVDQAHSDMEHDHDHSTPASSPPTDSHPDHSKTSLPSHAQPASDVQFSADNPWFGYPVVRVPQGQGYSIRPRYGRNRKRDLVKTLLWLFILRLQSLRASVESALGLNKITGLFSRAPQIEPRNPTEGLHDTAVARRAHTHAYPPTAVVRRQHDWIWMLIGFLVCRGTWAPFVGPALETLGLGALKEPLGLV